MKIIKNKLAKSQVELIVEMSAEELAPYFNRAAENISREMKIEGFRPGKVPVEILKAKIGEMTILEEVVNIAIDKNLNKIIKENIKEEAMVGRPEINIVKMAPGNPLEFKILVAVLPEIELGEYKNNKIKEEKSEVTEKEIEASINHLRENRATEIIADREIKDKDKVILGIEMFLDNVPVDGGFTKETTVIIGQGNIIPGFDKNLLGLKKDETKEFKLPYPEEHYMRNLAGKIVEFRVKIKEVIERDLPAMDDQLAIAFGLKSLEKLKKEIRDSLLDQKKKSAHLKAENEVLTSIIKNTKFSELPEILIKHEANSMMFELEETVRKYGGKFEDYLLSIKKTRDQLSLDVLPDAINRVKGSLVIREIAVKENINVTKEEVQANIDAMIEKYPGDEKMIEKIGSQSYANFLTNNIVNQKVLEKLAEWNIEK
jgi:trigger factor